MKITYLAEHVQCRLGQVVPLSELLPGEVGKRATWGGLYRIHNGVYEVNRSRNPDSLKWEYSDYNAPGEEESAKRNTVLIVRDGT